MAKPKIKKKVPRSPYAEIAHGRNAGAMKTLDEKKEKAKQKLRNDMAKSLREFLEQFE